MLKLLATSSKSLVVFHSIVVLGELFLVSPAKPNQLRLYPVFHLQNSNIEFKVFQQRPCANVSPSKCKYNLIKYFSKYLVQVFRLEQVTVFHLHATIEFMVIFYEIGPPTLSAFTLFSFYEVVLQPFTLLFFMRLIFTLLLFYI